MSAQGQALLGQAVEVKWKTFAIGRLLSHSLSIDGTQIPANNYDVGAISRFTQGRKSVTISVTCEYRYGDTNGINVLVADALKTDATAYGTLVIEPKAANVAGDHIWTANGAVSNVSLDASDDDVQTISFDFQVSETFTFALHT